MSSGISSYNNRAITVGIEIEETVESAEFQEQEVGQENEIPVNVLAHEKLESTIVHANFRDMRQVLYAMKKIVDDDLEVQRVIGQWVSHLDERENSTNFSELCVIRSKIKQDFATVFENKDIDSFNSFFVKVSVDLKGEEGPRAFFSSMGLLTIAFIKLREGEINTGEELFQCGRILIDEGSLLDKATELAQRILPWDGEWKNSLLEKIAMKWIECGNLDKAREVTREMSISQQKIDLVGLIGTEWKEQGNLEKADELFSLSENMRQAWGTKRDGDPIPMNLEEIVFKIFEFLQCQKERRATSCVNWLWNRLSTEVLLYEKQCEEQREIRSRFESIEKVLYFLRNGFNQNGLEEKGESIKKCIDFIDEKKGVTNFSEFSSIESKVKQDCAAIFESCEIRDLEFFLNSENPCQDRLSFFDSVKKVARTFIMLKKGEISFGVGAFGLIVEGILDQPMKWAQQMSDLDPEIWIVVTDKHIQMEAWDRATESVQKIPDDSPHKQKRLDQITNHWIELEELDKATDSAVLIFDEKFKSRKLRDIVNKWMSLGNLDKATDVAQRIPDEEMRSTDLGRILDKWMEQKNSAKASEVAQLIPEEYRDSVLAESVEKWIGLGDAASASEVILLISDGSAWNSWKARKRRELEALKR